MLRLGNAGRHFAWEACKHGKLQTWESCKKGAEPAMQAGYRVNDQSIFRKRSPVAFDTPTRKTEDFAMTLTKLLETGRSYAERIPDSVVSLAARVAVASVFWRSGQTKVSG